jgi:hypothetical protein
VSDANEQVQSLLAELRGLLASSDNDFAWSRWASASDALKDFDAVVASGGTRELLYLLAPTGSLQEVSMSSGWGDEFVRIANDIESMLGRPPSTSSP